MKSSRYRSLPGHKHMGESQGGGHMYIFVDSIEFSSH